MDSLVLRALDPKYFKYLNVTQKYFSILGSYLHGSIFFISMALLSLPLTCHSSDDYRLSNEYVTAQCTNQALRKGDVEEPSSSAYMVEYHR